MAPLLGYWFRPHRVVMAPLLRLLVSATSLGEGCHGTFTEAIGPGHSCVSLWMWWSFNVSAEQACVTDGPSTATRVHVCAGAGAVGCSCSLVVLTCALCAIACQGGATFVTDCFLLIDFLALMGGTRLGPDKSSTSVYLTYLMWLGRDGSR